MSKNVLYRKVIREWINGELIVSQESDFHYGELPDVCYYLMTADMDKIIKTTKLLSKGKSLILRRPYIENSESFDCPRWYRVKNYSFNERYDTIFPNRYTIKELAEILPAQEFIKFCEETKKDIDISDMI